MRGEGIYPNNIMKKLNKIILLLIFITLGFITLNKVEAASASITNSQTVTVGQTVNITATVTAGAWQLELSGNGKSIPFVGNVDITSGIADNVTKTSSSISFTPTSTGTYTFKLTGNITDFNTEEKSSIDKTCTITVKEQETTNTTTPTTPTTPEHQTPSSNDTTTPIENTNNNNQSKSSNNYLKSLTIGTGTLEPAFYRETTNYTIKFGDDFDYKSFTSLNVKASTEDSKAKVSGIGDIAINEGENNIAVRVTAENGSVRTYNIKVEKPVPLKQSDMRLKTLEISKIDKENNITKVDLNKEFDPETFEYSLDVDADTTELNVDATVEKQGIIVNIEGNKNLTEGENEVTIKLTSQDDDTINTTYKIIVNKAEAEKEENVEDIQENKKDLSNTEKAKYIIIGITALIAILFITLIVLIIINRKMKKSVKTHVEYENKGNKVTWVDEEELNGEQKNIEEVKEEKSKKKRIKEKEVKEEKKEKKVKTEKKASKRANNKKKPKGKHF